MSFEDYLDVLGQYAKEEYVRIQEIPTEKRTEDEKFIVSLFRTENDNTRM